MAGLDELRKRVEAAEQHFGVIATQSRKYSERLTRLVTQMEQTHAEQQREIAALNGRLGQFELENGQLKSMLIGLLHAIENGSDRVIDHAVRDLEGRVGRLMGSKAGAPAAEPAAAAPVEELDALDGPPAFEDATEIGVEGESEAAVEAERIPLPEPETVALDDMPEQPETLSDSANDLLDRVEAAANALLAGLDGDGGDESSELGEEITALLESAFHGEPAVGCAAEDDEPADNQDEDEDALLAAMMDAFGDDPGDDPTKDAA